MYELGYYPGKCEVLKFNSHHINVCRNIEFHTTETCWQLIHVDAFPILGIKPMREKKREPIECMAITVIAQRNGKDVVALLPTADFELGMTVRCVEILEEEE